MTLYSKTMSLPRALLGERYPARWQPKHVTTNGQQTHTLNVPCGANLLCLLLILCSLRFAFSILVPCAVLAAQHQTYRTTKRSVQDFELWPRWPRPWL
jgi:hypothetical protein